ncbi:ketopantoate reductase family protein [Bacillus tianshenii]|nr:ketopantoate reductase family protein [Bacillus tianshenii]
MNIVVLGAGALGAYFGGRWQEAGQEVQFLVRERRAAELKENGLTIHSVQGDYELEKLNIVQSVDEIEKVDLVLLAVKGYHLTGTIPHLKELVHKGAKVLPVLNGIEHIDILKEELGEEAVIGGLCFIIATLNEKGHVSHTSKQHDIVFGALHPSQQELCEDLAGISETANMISRHSDDILKDLWKKYMFISAFSGVTAAGNFPIGTVRNNPSTFQLASNVLLEMKQLANVYDIPLSDEHVDKATEQLNSFPDEATSSMHQDRRKGLTLEVEHLHGGAIRLAQKADLKLPYIETLYALIKPYEN